MFKCTSNPYCVSTYIHGDTEKLHFQQMFEKIELSHQLQFLLNNNFTFFEHQCFTCDFTGLKGPVHVGDVVQ